MQTIPSLVRFAISHSDISYGLRFSCISWLGSIPPPVHFVFHTAYLSLSPVQSPYHITIAIKAWRLMGIFASGICDINIFNTSSQKFSLSLLPSAYRRGTTGLVVLESS
jgi:hypothetical protein